MIVREAKIKQSVQTFIEDQLAAQGYDATHLDVREEFPTEDERASQLEKTQVAIGWDFDTGGRQVELGSNLRLYIHTFNCWVFGTTPEYGESVASMVRLVVEANEWLIPLIDIEVDGDPVIDMLVVPDSLPPSIQRQYHRDPRPWDRNVWMTTVKVEDYFDPTTQLVAP